MIRSSSEVDAISAAWVAAAAEMPNVTKESTGQVGNVQRKYADLATVVETIRPILAKHDLAYVQGCSDGDKIVTVTTRLVHTSGQWMEDSLSMPTGQNTAQAVGSAITYARRYSLMAVLGLAPDDDDGAAASTPVTRSNTPNRPAVRSATSGKASEAQITKLVTAFGEFGVKQRDERLRYLTKVAGREITSSKDLTSAEASKAIEAIELAIRMEKDGAA